MTVLSARPGEVTAFVRGDVNRDDAISITDPILVIRALMGGDHTVIEWCLDAADADNDGGIKLSDAVYLLQFLFAGGPQPPLPYPEPGVDTGWDQLACGNAG